MFFKNRAKRFAPIVIRLLCALLALTMLTAVPEKARAAAGDVTLISCTSGGAESTGTCQDPSISAGGRYVAFTSTSSNLAPGVTANSIFRKDIASGEVTLCSCSPDGTSGNQASGNPAISADGTYVAFISSSTNLIPGNPTNGHQQVFRKDLVTGEIMLCSSRPDGTQGNQTAGEPCISADGRFVVFASSSTNLLLSGSTSDVQVFRKDLATGDTVLVSCSPAGTQGNGMSDEVAVNSDSRYATFVSWATNLIPGSPTSGVQVFRKDVTTGEVVLVSSSALGTQGDQDSYTPDINTDGRYASFESTSGNLVPGTAVGRKHVYRKDLQSGEVRLCSINGSGDEGNSSSGLATISANGAYVCFCTEATNLSPDAVNGQEHVVRKSLAGGEIACCSVSAAGQPGNHDSVLCDISSDGKFVAFDSKATNLIDGETNTGKQIFRKELGYNTFFYFAEGYTGEGFQEYLCLGNPGETGIDVAVTYVFTGDDPVTETLPVPAGSRVTVDVNAEVGAGRDVSIRTASTSLFVAERPIYFRYGPGWTGGHDVVGAPCPDTSWYFAEGYTGSCFDEWVCVLNPGLKDADLIFRFQTQEAGEVVRDGYAVPAGSRATFKVNEVLGADYQTSVCLQSDQPVVAERPIYFDYTGTGNYAWTGGHCVMGTTYLKREYYFAEGYTGQGFEEWLTLQNPYPLAVIINAVYQFADGAEPLSLDYEVAAGTRRTIFVGEEVGLGRDVSVKLTCDSPFLAERPMYFSYSGTGSYGWTGGHCVIGASFRRNDLFFAEGYTGAGFEEWLCVQNPGTSTSHVRITYYTQEAGALPPREADIPAGSRVTFNVNEHAGAGYQLSSRVEVVSGPWIIVERPMYFNFNAWTGGHDVVGYGL